MHDLQKKEGRTSTSTLHPPTIPSRLYSATSTFSAMDAQQMVLEKVPHTIQIRYSFAPYPGADLKTIELTLPEGALVLDAIRHLRIENNVPVYLEHSMLSTAQSLIQSTHKTRMEQEVKLVNQSTFLQDTQDVPITTSGDKADAGSEESICVAEIALQKAMIENYRSNTSQFYTQPEEVMIYMFSIMRCFILRHVALTRPYGPYDRTCSRKHITPWFTRQYHIYSMPFWISNESMLEKWTHF